MTRPGRAHVDALLATAARRKVHPRSAASDGLRSKDLKPLWQAYLPHLRASYGNICAYLGMYIHCSTGAPTVDHFKPKSDPRYRKLAYEWRNLRLASAQMNTNKGAHRDVLDPFEIEDGWFELHIGTFEVLPSPTLTPTQGKKVQATIDRLKLNDPNNIESRADYHDRYMGLSPETPPLPLSWLESECPYVARELRRQGRLRAPIRVRIPGSNLWQLV